MNYFFKLFVISVLFIIWLNINFKEIINTFDYLIENWLIIRLADVPTSEDSKRNYIDSYYSDIFNTDLRKKLYKEVIHNQEGYYVYKHYWLDWNYWLKINLRLWKPENSIIWNKFKVRMIWYYWDNLKYLSDYLYSTKVSD